MTVKILKKIILKSILFIIICCTYLTAYSQEIYINIPANINLYPKEINQFIKKDINVKETNYKFEITIYYYSNIIETLLLDDEENFRLGYKKGCIKVLLKIKKNNVLKKAIFIKATGNDKMDILKNISLKLKKIIEKI